MTGFYDIHSHLLPGVDDGAKSGAETEALIDMEYKQGVRNIIMTPHYRPGMFEPNENEILEAYGYAEKIVRKKGYDMNIYLGCEFYADVDILEILECRKDFFLNQTQYFLIEFPVNTSQLEMREILCTALSYGWVPVLAHVERYDIVGKKLDFVEELSDLGVFISVNAGSVIGEEGFSQKRLCHRLLKKNLVDLIGSDAHGISRRKPMLGPCGEYLKKKYGADFVKRIMLENPKNIVEGK